MHAKHRAERLRGGGAVPAGPMGESTRPEAGLRAVLVERGARVGEALSRVTIPCSLVQIAMLAAMVCREYSSSCQELCTVG